MLTTHTLTNALELEFHYERILSDYSFFAIHIPYTTQNKHAYKTIYGEIKHFFKPKARWIQRSQNGHTYILAFSKGELPTSSNYEIQKIGLSELKNISRKGMLSILLSLMMYQSSFFELSNNPYDIFYIYSIEKSKAIALNIVLKEVNQNVYISWAATHFKKVKENTGDCYIEESGILIPYKEEVHKGLTLYQRGNFKSAKVSIPFLGLDAKSFPSSKSYYMNLIYQDIQKYLSEYMSLNFKTKKVSIFSDGADKEKQKKELAHYLSQYTQLIGKLHIANLSEDTEFGEKLYQLIQECFGKSLTLSISSKLSKKIPQISITKPKEYYNKETENDPYLEIKKIHLPIQNITLDSKVNSTIVNVLIKELALKCELFGYGTFIEHHMTSDDISYYHIEDKENDIFYKATVKDSKIFTSAPTEDEQLMLERIMFNVPIGEVLEAVITVNHQDIMLLTKTEIFPLPHFIALFQKYTEAIEDFYFSKEDIILYSKNISPYPCPINTLSSALDTISTSKGIPSSKLMGLGEKIITRKLKNILENKAGRPLRFLVRDGATKKDLLGGLLGITYYEEDNTILYHTGLASGNIQSSIDKNSPYRRIHSIKGSLNLDAILPFLEEYFVKYNELTVLPYPLKYAREGFALST